MIHRDMIACAEHHFSICKEAGVQLDNEQWYKHVAESFERRRRRTTTTSSAAACVTQVSVCPSNDTALSLLVEQDMTTDIA